MDVINEAQVVLYQEKIIDHGAGTPGSVEFNFDIVWQFIRTCKDFDPRELHFIHTHPGGDAAYSERDKNCLKGFAAALGTAPLFSIAVFTGGDIKKTECVFKTYLLEKGEVIEVPPKKCSKEVLQVLKLLSLGQFNELRSFL